MSINTYAVGDANPNISYLLWGTSVVLFMSPGVAFLYAGLTRNISTNHMLTLVFATMAVITVQWFLFGFSLSFSETGSSFIGDFNMGALVNVQFAPLSLTAPTVPALAFALYQMQFATVTGTIVFGSVADRIRFMPALLFIFVWTTLVYNPVTYWSWGARGWLRNLGSLNTISSASPAGIGSYDYAGGGPVHVAAGFAGLAYALYIGKRKPSSPNHTKPGNLGFIYLGTAMLWFGWLGFNGGSSLSPTTRGLVAATNTTVAGSAGAIVWLLLDYIFTKKVSGLAFCNGALAGLATVTPGSGFIAPWAAFVIGILASMFCRVAIRIKEKLNFDDSFDAWGVHGLGGFIGLLLTGIFAQNSIANLDGTTINGGWLDRNWIQLWYQLVAAVSIAAWAFVGTFVICVVIDHIPGLRLRQDPKSEMMGADPSEMAEPLITEVMVSLKELNQFPDASNKVSATQPVGATSKMDPDNIQRA